MRILALRVRNLASLAGDVVLDFEAPPLAGAGLFAITGPTGAGKSTLLDALCLALYDELPRLAQGGDVRSVLRHGAADGYAEVEFVGRAGGRHKARWEVRRARGRVDGRLQAQAMSLTDLGSGTVIAGGKRETLRAIEEAVGLDYHQFRRSVLLAQNDFDAFLRAKPDERAALLELMTGTAIYGRLSVAAFLRSRDEESALKALDDELKRVNVLDDEARATLEGEAAQAEALAARLAAEFEALGREADWHRTALDLARRVAEAEAHCASAEADWAAAEPERARLARVRRALTLAPLVTEADRLAAKEIRLAAEQGVAEESLATRAAALAQAATERDAARRADEGAEASLRAAEPDLARAADLDTRLSEAETRLHAATGAHADSKNLVTQGQAALDAVTRERQAAADTLAGLESWIADHRDHQPLAEQSERWLDAIAAHAAAAADRHAAEARAKQAVAEQERLAARLAADKAAAEERGARLEALDAQIAERSAQLDAVDIDGLDRRREALESLIRAVAGLETLSAEAAAIDAQDAEGERRRIAAQARGLSAAEDAGTVTQALGRVAVALTEAQAALALAEAANGEQAEVLRQRLRPGEPCPVCGARTHPVGEIHTALTGLLAQQRQRVDDLRAERDSLIARQATARAEEKAAAELVAQIGQEARGLAERRARVADRRGEATRAVAAWAASCGLTLAPPGAPPGAAPAESEALGAVRRAGETEREAIGARLRALRTVEAGRREALDRREEVRAEAEAAARQQAAAETARIEAVARGRAASAEAERARGAMEQAAARLEAPLRVVPDGRTRLENAPDALAHAVRTLAAAWRDNVARAEAARDGLRRLESKVESAVVALDTARRNAAGARAVEDGERASRDALRRARAALFEGRPTAEVRDALGAARDAARRGVHQAHEAWAAAAQETSAAESRVATLAQARADTVQAAGQARTGLAGRLAADGIDAAEVRAAMALGDDWLATAEAHDAARREAVTIARTVRDERRAAEAAHAGAGRPAHEAETLAELLPARAQARDAARDALARLALRRAEDDRNRDAAADTRRRIGEQRARFDLWRGIADLIGAHDGKKFRLFAQGLTLDRLVGLANRHLAELTPRYALQRAPGPDLDLLVVDRDMADEARGVANLSGGERFLVSLSLALGLASMTGGRALAESLFIDEGFGALDAESLDVAIGALETLHASGRKVGVISHVQAMIDRIGVQVRVVKRGGGRSAVTTGAA